MKTDNQIIAEFMEVSRCTDKIHAHDPCFYYESEGGYITSERMKYQKSWDWLMPVVEKIDRLGFSVTIRRTRTIIETVLTGRIVESIHPDYSMIEVTYCGVVEFIKWYNKQNLLNP
jgi:hypothetical protein